MADLDTLRIRGIPFRALVDGAGVAVSGADTIRDLKDEGMQPICEVDETGTGVVNGETLATLRNRGIPVFCEVGEDGLAGSGHTLSQLRDRGIPGCCIVGLDGIAQGGSLTIAQLRERGIASFCPVDEDGVETGLGTARMTLVGRTIAENSANGTTIGTLGTVNTTGTAAFTLVDTAGGRFSLTGSLLKVANGTLLDYETNQSHSITVSVTGVTPAIANRTFLIVVTDVDDTAPTITSSNAVSIAEDTVLSHTLSADETVTWTKIGGADTAQFTLTGNVLGWATTPTRDFEAPADADLNNTYVVQVRATDAASLTADQTITVTVTDATIFPQPATPVLALTSGPLDAMPDFTLTGDLQIGDTVRFQYSTASDFTGASEATNTIDIAEDAADTISFATGTLASTTWWFRARIERVDAPVSNWSNTVTETITAPTYEGPGDIVAGAIGWWGLRGYSAANIGSPAIQVKRAGGSPHDVLIAADGIIDVSDAYFNGSTPYEILKFYDQSGSGKNIDVAAVASTYPVLLLNDNGTLPAIHNLAVMDTALGITNMAQPFSVSCVARRASASGAPSLITYLGDAPFLIGFSIAANSVSMYGGVTTADVAAADAATHALGGVFNNTSSKLAVDGTTTTGLSIANAGTSGTGGIRFPQAIAGGVLKSWECGWWASDISTNFAALSVNQRDAWGLPP